MPADRPGRLRTSWRTVLASGLGLLLTSALLRWWGARVPKRPVRRALPSLPSGFSAPAEWSEPELEEVEPERRDARTSAVLTFGLGLAVLFGLMLMVVTTIQIVFTGRWPDLRPPRGGADDPPAAEAPLGVVVEGLPGQNLASLRATEAALLNNYGWVDQAAGVVRLPIERAMQLVVERGLPLEPGAETRDYSTYGSGLPLDSSSGRTSEDGSP